MNKINGWNWNLTDENVLSGWFDDYKNYINENNLVKTNNLRDVFTLNVKDNVFYVKYDRPRNFLNKIKRIFNSKVKSEFLSAQLLKEKNIPVVDVLGYGSNGSEGMLISREEKKSISAKDYWFDVACDNEKKKNVFISEFIKLIQLLLDNNIFHPDLHLDNILYNPKNNKFVLVDIYGVKSKKIKEKDKLLMLEVFTSFRENISNKEFYEILKKFDIGDNLGELKLAWKRILQRISSKVRTNWKKRQKKIIANSAIYCKVIKNKNNEALCLRNSQGNKILIEDKLAMNNNKLEKEFIVRQFPVDIAEKIWLSSFCLQFHAIPHRKIILFNKANGSLYFERLEKAHKVENFEKEREFIERCNIAGLNTKNIETKIKEINNIVFFDDITI